MVSKAIKDGIIKALRTAAFLLAIIIPISLGVTLLRHTGFFLWLADKIEPAMRIFGLPGEAVVPIVVGAFADEYATAAVMNGFSFNAAHSTIIAMVVLAFHSLPVETVITRQIGMPAFRMALLRLGLAVFTGIVVAIISALFIGGNMPGTLPDAVVAGGAIQSGSAAGGIFDASREVILNEMGMGVLNTVFLLLRVLIPLMIGIELMMAYKIIEAMAKKLGFFCKLLDIGKEALLPLLVGLFLGVTYGAGAIAEMNRVRPLPKKDMALLGVFLFSCHGIIENTYLFALAGANAIIISVFRLAIAIGLTAATGRLVLREKQEENI